MSDVIKGIKQGLSWFKEEARKRQTAADKTTVNRSYTIPADELKIKFGLAGKIVKIKVTDYGPLAKSTVLKKEQGISSIKIMTEE